MAPVFLKRPNKRMVTMKIILLLTMLFFFPPGIMNAEASGDAEISVNFMKELLGGDKFERDLMESFPGAEIKWFGEVIETGEEQFTCLVYSEFSRPEREILYQVYEVRVRYIPLKEIFE
jgi:hypothetical protein